MGGPVCEFRIHCCHKIIKKCVFREKWRGVCSPFSSNNPPIPIILLLILDLNFDRVCEIIQMSLYLRSYGSSQSTRITGSFCNSRPTRLDAYRSYPGYGAYPYASTQAFLEGFGFVNYSILSDSVSIGAKAGVMCAADVDSNSQTENLKNITVNSKIRKLKTSKKF
ncbi:Protein CBG20963 [Caenorhabditis briggsae]|uniref:Protein CBG20963 n=1 Tax=Caenorhabditis briggsae TaxID=6238 RepID=A8XZ21_CAEBR|nr:Protein CBG20963 [Caenorhabditis briggsae]CAP37888.1 Protein CBG20963 [Caenorhabditis briggsae]